MINKSRFNTIILVIAYLLSIAFCISAFAWFIGLVFYGVVIIDSFVLISDLIIVILIWGLHNTLERIEIIEKVLEKKKVLQETDVITALTGQEDVSLCKHCGYQLFEEDDKCPNCGKSKNVKK